MKPAASEPEERDEEGLGGITFTKKKETIAVTAALAWGSLGCIYGDIGTSPLYVYSTIFSSSEPSQADILGAISLIFWTLTLIVLVKYVGVVLLADDEGEGGTFSLYSLLCRKIGIRPHDVMFRGESRMMRNLGSSSTGGSQARTLPRASGSGTRVAGLGVNGDGTLRRLSATPEDAARGPDTTLTLATSASRRFAGPAAPHPQQPRRVWWRRWAASGTAVRAALRRNRAAQMGLWGMTMAATGMVLGDGVLTPAISVMSAVSGLKEATDAVTQQTVVGVSIAVLVLLFSVQRCGTSKVSSTFAPIVALWLCANAGVAAYNLALHGGGALAGLSPHHIPLFFARRGVEAWRMLGSVMLCVTGAEALYADLGHFTHRSVLVGFCLFVYPCLVLTYVGQGAYLMSRPEDVSDTFWKCVPRPFFYPMLVLATLASVVASQALITGCFSIISNAIKLGAFPKLSVLHTSEHVRGQVYVAEINWTLMLLCVGVVAGFKDTVALGLAYGLAVSSVFVLTTLLILVVMVAVWEVSLALVAPFALVFLIIELAFLSSNMAKVPEGAWFSLAVSAGGIYVMTIWWVGSTRRALLLAASAGRNRLSELFVMMPLQPQQSHMAAPAAQVPQPQQVRREAPRAIAESLEDGHQQEAEQQEMQGAARSSTGADAAAARTVTAATPQPAAAPGASSGGGLLHPEREIVTASNTPSSGTHGSATPADGGAIGHLPSRRRTAATATSALAAAAGISGRSDGNAAVPTSSHPHKSDSLSRGSPAQLLAAVSARLSMWRPVQLALRLPPQPLLGADGSAAVGSQGQGLGLGADGAGAEQQQQQQLWPLSRQPGIGLYYSETPVGLPHVLIHFLRNVQSVHDVSVFLTVRVVPLPHVQPVERLLVRQLAPFPNFYQVVARYGYMDRVDHGAAFIRQVVSGIVRVLRGGPAVAADVTTVAATGGGTGADTAAAAAPAAGDGIAGSGSGSSGGGAGGFRFVTRNRRSNGHRGSQLSSRRGVDVVSASAAEEQERQGGQAGQQPQQPEQPQGGWSLYGMGLSRRGGMVLQPGEVDFVSSSSSSSDRGYNSAVEEDSDSEDEDEVEAVLGVSAAVAHSSNVSGGGGGTAGGNTGGNGGVELSEVVVVAAHTAQVRADHAPAPQPPAALLSPSTGAPPPVSLPAAPAALQASRSRPRLARAARGVTSQLPSGGRVVVDEAAVAHVLEAARHGVVYYLGAVRVRPEPGSPLLAQLLFGATYRLLLGLSRSEVEDWRLPYEHVVELGMVLRIG
ncbi:hypothetical protein CHLRE_17g714150v5 [Chlamydomonas reinhardtii]|uniref:Potassium transporter n=1 Tax=Chlamydomonas reinhardtii TaxID=3055 RepID=A0A2K3CPT6_CHLRE|nr:uncharacterized protein CHLRE_17g714150v5 [Chlamydomonas reinhardtii]PNW70301.1 hypothetical protein CHLRE_17g714150v5 [Chlamydomonas reinhardtii]